MQMMTVKNQFLEVEFVLPTDDVELGNRFCRGAWIRNVLHRESHEGYFVAESIEADALVFGCPHEFRTAIPLSDRDCTEVTVLKIGVGRLLHRKGSSRFDDKLLQAYPWQCTFEKRNDVDQALCVQEVSESQGYGYILEQRISIEGSTLKIGNRLKNTGSKRLETEVYIHPFFDERQKDGQYWYQIPQHTLGAAAQTSTMNMDRVNLEAFPPNNVPIPGDVLCSAYNWIATGSRKTGRCMGIYSESSFSKINMWREPGLCYAIEPYLPIDLEPGESQLWNWCLHAGQENEEIRSMGRGGWKR
ncbi:MAG: hypothetical protein JKX85_04970 [Phycisphaeraceae bacterium]|nr:hypothetical protein [Phycisphaeraceae bacterium]